MSRLPFNIILLGLLFAATACSKPGSGKGQDAGYTPPQGLIASYNEMTQIPLTCLGDCPEAIGEILHFGEGPATSCTATLIDHDTVMTASHCVEKAVGQNQSCFVRWPKSDRHEARTIECAKLVHASKFRRDQQFQLQKKFEKDYALVKLSRPIDREPLPFNTDSLASSSEFQVRVFGVVTQNTEHQVSSMNCVYQSSMTLNDQNYSDRNNLMLRDCPIQMGFSGGPIFSLKAPAQPIGLISMMKLQAHEFETRIAIGTRPPPIN